MMKTFGKGWNFWVKGHDAETNGIALMQTLHQQLDFGALAFLPNLNKENAKNKDQTGTKQFLCISKGSMLDLSLTRGSINDIKQKKNGFEVFFGGGLMILIDLDVPASFDAVCSFFDSGKKKVKHLVSTLSNVKADIQQQLKKELSFFYLEAPATDKKLIKKALARICRGDSTVRMIYHLKDPLGFYSICGLMARALRVLGHKDFKDLKNGGYHGDDDFCDRDGSPSRSLPDAEEREALLRRAVHDSQDLAGLCPDSKLKGSRKRKQC